MGRTAPSWRRRVAIGVLLVALVTLPGCAALTGGGETTTGGGTASESTQTTTESTQTTTAADTTTGTNDSSNAGSDGAENGTADVAATGEMSVVVGDTELDVNGAGPSGAGFRFDDEQYHTWHTGSSAVTLAEALDALGVDATARTLAYDGETYRESTDGTEVVYRVNGEPVDPESYTLADGDEVWVVVETADMNRDVPGEYIHEDHLHMHGSMTLSVDGTLVNFSRDRYQRPGENRYFHFEGGHSTPWHAHSYGVTAQYALNTLPGINVTDDSLTYENETYRADDPGTTIRVTVNGESVDPSEYYLKDGDHVEIAVKSDDGG